MALLAERSKPAYTGVAAAFDYSNINSDLAFQGRGAYSGNYRGFGAYDVSDPAAPELKTTVDCVGGQGDVPVQSDLFFMSVESTSARVDCTTSTASAVFRGVREGPEVRVGDAQGKAGQLTAPAQQALADALVDPANDL